MKNATRFLFIYLFSVYNVGGKEAEAKLNVFFFKNATTHASRRLAVQLSHRRSPLHTRISCSSVRTICSGLSCYQCDMERLRLKTPVRTRDTKQKYWRHSAFGLPFSFNSFDPSKGLQSLLFKCYFLFTPRPPNQNDNTIHEHSCTCVDISGLQWDYYVQSSTQKVNEEAIFHIIIVLSVVDRNKSMQYSSLAVVFLVSDLAPNLRWGQCPEVSLGGFQRIILERNWITQYSVFVTLPYQSLIPNAIAVQVPRGNFSQFCTNNDAKKARTTKGIT